MTDGAPELVLGPLLRYVAETEATIWVETDRACQVGILDHQAQTFEVAGHHYALVVIGDLQPGQQYEYQVTLDGAVRWPEPGSDFPPSTLRTTDPDRPVRLAYGSCRIAELPVLPRRRTRAIVDFRCIRVTSVSIHCVPGSASSPVPPTPTTDRYQRA